MEEIKDSNPRTSVNQWNSGICKKISYRKYHRLKEKQGLELVLPNNEKTINYLRIVSGKSQSQNSKGQSV